MIYVLLTRRHRYTVDALVEAHGGRLPFAIAAVPYEEAAQTRFVEPATLVFADLERLTTAELESAAGLWNTLRGRGGLRLLNHPTRVMRRYELLRTLFELGVNDFDVYRLSEARRPRRYPVFIRGEYDHRGSRTVLLRAPAELEAAIRALDEAGRCREERLVVEFRETADARGHYRKYAAFVIGGTVIPDHLMIRREWCVKTADPDLLDAALLAEECAYVRANPHAELVRRVFAIGRADYGRLDYAFVDGRMVVFELNTNPWTHHPDRSARQRDFPGPSFDERLIAALAALDAAAEGAGRQPGGSLAADRGSPGRPQVI
jgi:hypothetical protein